MINRITNLPDRTLAPGFEAVDAVPAAPQALISNKSHLHHHGGVCCCSFFQILDGDILSLSRSNLIDEHENETIACFLLWLTFCNVSVLAPLHYAEKRDRRWQYWYLLKMIIHFLGTVLPLKSS